MTSKSTAAQCTLANVAGLLTSGHWTDLTITCQGRNFKVHKAIVCPASTVITAACNSVMQEGSTGIIKHNTFDADTVSRMLTYIYTQDYAVEMDTLDDIDIPAGQNVKRMLAHVRVYAIAEYYDVQNLQELASWNFMLASHLEWGIEHLIDVVREVYNLTSAASNSLKCMLQTIASLRLGDIVGNATCMAGLAEAEGTQEFMAYLLSASFDFFDARSSDAEKARAKAVKERDELQERLKVQQKETAHLKTTGDVLVHKLKTLHGPCRNTGCDRHFDRLQAEPTGTPGPGGVLSDWQVRCSKCKARQFA